VWDPKLQWSLERERNAEWSRRSLSGSGTMQVLVMNKKPSCL